LLNKLYPLPAPTSKTFLALAKWSLSNSKAYHFKSYYNKFFKYQKNENSCMPKDIKKNLFYIMIKYEINTYEELIW